MKKEDQLTNIPIFDTNTGYLKPGIYSMTLKAISEHNVLARNSWRKKLITNLKEACEFYWSHKITEIFIDGSFITEKPFPNDIDGYIITEGYKDKRLLTIAHSGSIWGDYITRVIVDGKVKTRMRLEKNIEFFIHPIMKADETSYFTEFFRLSRDGNPKGIIKIIQ